MTSTPTIRCEIHSALFSRDMKSPMQLPCGVWMYLPALFAEVYLLSTPRLLVWVVEHAQVPRSWTEAVAVHKGWDSV